MFIRLSTGLLFCALFVGCASKVLEYDKAQQLETNEEYEAKLKVREIPEAPQLITAPAKSEPSPSVKHQEPVKVAESQLKEKKMKKEPMIQPREPKIEDAEGFLGRRPIEDPFRVGERVTLALSYFNVVAGNLEMQVLPFVEVNGEKSYNFQISAKSNSFFSNFYSVDDLAITYMSYEKMLPVNMEIRVKESKQLMEVRTFFDFKKKKGFHWQKKVTKDKGERSKKIEWNILPFSQNVISAIYYLRNFTLTPGKKISFHVADEGKNIIFKGEVLRREKLKTEIGELDTVVVRPEFEVDGVFKPVGEILFWLTDDSRKFIVRLESKIKIGTIVGKLKALDKGQ